MNDGRARAGDAPAEERARRHSAALYAVIVLVSALVVLNPLAVRLVFRPSLMQVAYLLVLDLGLAAIVAALALYLRAGRRLYGAAAAVGLGLLPFALFAAELGLTHIGVVHNAAEKQAADSGLFLPDPLVGWRLRADTVVDVTLPDGRRVNYATGPAGLRPTVEPIAGRPTLHVFGDSFAFGEGVSNDAAALRLLAERYRGAVNVRNYAVPGYGPMQMFRAFGRAAERVRPGDTVLFWVFSEDLMRNLTHKAFLCRQAVRNGARMMFPVRSERGRVVSLDESCGPIETLLLLSDTFPMGAVYNHLRTALLHDELIAEADAYFRRARDLAERRGADFLVVMLASGDECRRGAFRFDVADLRTPYVSMLPSCPADAAAAEALAFPTDPHWSAAGNRWAATVLAGILRNALPAFRPQPQAAAGRPGL